MATGFQSNYIDSGYTFTGNIWGTWYDQSGNVVSDVSARDIYYTTQQTGVYMIDGSVGASNIFYPVNCSADNLINIGMSNDVDDAWLIYPGYGFTLYPNSSYTGTQSRSYINTSTVPQLFYCASPGGWVGYGSPILDVTGTVYAGNKTSSVRIYFRGTQIRSPTIS